MRFLILTVVMEEGRIWEAGIMWQFNNHGKCTVKSGYHLLETLESMEADLLAIIQEMLTRKSELARRHIEENNLCPLCNQAEETEVHVCLNV